MSRAIVALGGHALLRGGSGSIQEQRRRIVTSVDALEGLADRGFGLVITHGNGPQVGARMLEQAKSSVLDQPLDVLVAETQAQIGYLLVQELDGRLDDDTPAVSIVTRAVVDADDPAFDDPSKPIGPSYTREEANSKSFETAAVTTAEGETVYRRVVPSPRPRAVREIDRIGSLVESGAPVVCAGGGGVPVVEGGGVDGERDGTTGFADGGVAAVIDKDDTSTLLAQELDATTLVFLTDVECAYVHFGEPDQQPIGETDPAALRAHLRAGEFGAGSMQPKVEACVAFVTAGGERAIITTPERLEDALEGEAGTRVTPASG